MDPTTQHVHADHQVIPFSINGWHFVCIGWFKCSLDTLMEPKPLQPLWYGLVRITLSVNRTCSIPDFPILAAEFGALLCKLALSRVDYLVSVEWRWEFSWSPVGNTAIYTCVALPANKINPKIYFVHFFKCWKLVEGWNNIFLKWLTCWRMNDIAALNQVESRE